MLDQQDLVPLFVVDQLIDDRLGDQHPESSGSQAQFPASPNLIQHFLRTVCPMGTSKISPVESAARITEVIDDCSRRPRCCLVLRWARCAKLLTKDKSSGNGVVTHSHHFDNAHAKNIKAIPNANERIASFITISPF